VNPGETKKIKHKVLGGSLTSGALGNFQIIFEGDLSKDELGDWEFNGTMEFYDEWDFNIDGARRSSGGQDLVKVARDYLVGTDFKVYSEKVKVSQKKGEIFVDWWNSFEPKEEPNRVYEN